MIMPYIRGIRVCICSVLLVGLAYGLDSKQLESTLQAQGLSAQVVQKVDSGLQGFTFAIVEQDRFWIPLLAHDSGKIILGISPSLVFSKDEKFDAKLEALLQKVSLHNKQITDDGVLKVFKQHANSTITIANKSAKNTLYMVLDPNCPYCKNEIEKLEEYAKDSTLVLMIVGILKQSSIDKAAAFTKLIQSAKAKNEQIAALKRVFDKNFDPSSVRFDKPTEQEAITAKLTLIGLELQKAGLQGVPYIIKTPAK